MTGPLGQSGQAQGFTLRGRWVAAQSVMLGQDSGTQRREGFLPARIYDCLLGVCIILWVQICVTYDVFSEIEEALLMDMNIFEQEELIERQHLTCHLVVHYRDKSRCLQIHYYNFQKSENVLFCNFRIF